ncbi:MAG: bifunctional transaldolase/phosoglucose isomerase [Pyrinomonadaceae bacterium]|nr:bifunctional transaldolase/phosoglucose isomerase [Chloracidobacterium sp.]
MLSTIEYSLPNDLEAIVNNETENWKLDDTIARIWAKDASVWTNDDEAKWLGWLDIVGEELGDLQKYRDLQTDLATAGFKDVLLMGMGGSSLCPEVLAMTFGKANFHILDSTVPAQVKAVEDKLDLLTTLFIVASKSGSTLEPNCFTQYFFEKVADAVGRENAGKQFIAITDPGSKMEQVANEDGFRHIFYGKPQIGGRFSALSAFGMTAAAAMGLEVESFLGKANEMVDACRVKDVSANPGASLGLILGICHKIGRDKLTIFTSPEIHDLGAWMEQLVAESTGKNGVSIIPVDREPIQETAKYGDDRIFAFLSLKGDTSFDDAYRELTSAGHPAVKIELGSIDNLGQEFFRWEFATAVAGSVMQINPFNQPDVEAAKIEARKITDEYEKTGSLPDEKAFFEADGVLLFTGDDHAKKLETLADAAGERSLRSVIDAHLAHVIDGDYFAILGYIEMNSETEPLLQTIREKVLARTGVATCLGFGPRFLHSTGQAYKGGANNGVFLQITSDDVFDLAVPAQKYTFGVVKSAQSRGDFQVLLDRGRRALRVHLGTDVKSGLKMLSDLV